MAYRGGYKQLFEAAHLLKLRGVFDDSIVSYPRDMAMGITSISEAKGTESKIDEFSIPFPVGTYHYVTGIRQIENMNTYRLTFVSEEELYTQDMDLRNVPICIETDSIQITLLISENGDIKYEGVGIGGHSTRTGKVKIKGVFTAKRTGPTFRVPGRGSNIAAREYARAREFKPIPKPSPGNDNGQSLLSNNPEELPNSKGLSERDYEECKEVKGVASSPSDGAGTCNGLGDSGNSDIRVEDVPRSRPIFRAPGSGDLHRYKRTFPCKYKRAHNPYSGNM